MADRIGRVRDEFGERIRGSVDDGSITAELGVLVMHLFDESVEACEADAPSVVERVADRQDITFILYGRFTGIARWYGDDGHSVASVVGGEIAPITTPKDFTQRRYAKNQALLVAQAGACFANVVRRGIGGINDDTRAHKAVVVRYRTPSGLSVACLTVVDRTKDTRPGSHTDFYVVERGPLVWWMSCGTCRNKKMGGE